MASPLVSDEFEAELGASGSDSAHVEQQSSASDHRSPTPHLSSAAISASRSDSRQAEEGCGNKPKQSGPTAAEPWPDDVILYQQYQAEQITFPDSASCLSVKAFLYMCGLNFQVELKTNAEEMSPSGKVPFIHVGAFLVSEIDPIIAFVNAKGFSLTSDLSATEQSEMRAYMAMIDNILVNAELYLAWLEDTVASEVTKPRYGCPYPWPLNWILPLRKQSEIRARLSSNGWKDKSMQQVCEEVRTCCQALSERLDQQEYFFGSRPTELDALVFGHLYTLITTELPVGQFADVIEQFSNLTDFCKRIEEKYFK